MIDCLFYQQYHFVNACSQGRSETRNVLRWTISLRSWEGLSCSYRQWRPFNCFFVRLLGAIANKSQRTVFSFFMVVCKLPIFRVITLFGEHWLQWLIGLAGIFFLWLPTCVDEMGWGILVTVQYKTYWSQTKEGMQSHN